MRKASISLNFMTFIILSVVLMGVSTLFMTSDIGQPIFESLNEFMFPEMTQGCDASSVNSIRALAYSINCTAMAHSNVDNDILLEQCPPQKSFGDKVAICPEYPTDDYQCVVPGFELNPDPEYSGDPQNWIAGMGDPNCIVYYESFPEDQSRYWTLHSSDWDWTGIMIGGIFNAMLTSGGKTAVKSILSPKRLFDGTLTESFKKSIKRTAKFATDMPVIIKEAKTKVSKLFIRNTFSDEKIAKKALMNVYKTTDTYLLKNTEATGESFEKISRYTTQAAFENIQKRGHETTKDMFEKQLRELLEQKGVKIGPKSADGAITNKELNKLVNHEWELITYVSKKSQISPMKRLQLWNLYGETFWSLSEDMSAKGIKTTIERSSKILDSIPTSQRQAFMKNTRELSDSFMASAKDDPVFWMWFNEEVFSEAPDLIYEDPKYSEEMKSMGTCAAFFGSTAIKTLPKGGSIFAKGAQGGLMLTGSGACALTNSIGIMAQYIDNQNEKYDPVGINSLGYKSNYVEGVTQELNGYANQFFVALDRDAVQENKRFFLASPCKTEKIVIRYEPMKCYYQECEPDLVCCERKKYDYESDSYVHNRYEWSSNADCVSYGDDLYSGTIHNTGEVLKGAIIYSPGSQAYDIIYSWVDEDSQDDDSIELPTGQKIDADLDFVYQRPDGSYPEKVDDSYCDDEVPEIKQCLGAVDDYESNTISNMQDISFYTEYPNIRTVKSIDDIDASSDMNNKIEVKAATDIYKKGSNGQYIQIDSNEYDIQAVDQLEDSDITELYVGDDAQGIKQCPQASERIQFKNLFNYNIEYNVDAIVVDVELDESFQGDNYCYTGVDYFGSAIKATAMIGSVAVDAVVTAATGTIGTPLAMLATGMAYEAIDQWVDKQNLWPKR